MSSPPVERPAAAPAPAAGPPTGAAAALDDPARLAALRATGLLDTRADAALDRLSRLAARVLHAPVALVTLVDADRQLLKGCAGLPAPWDSTRETPLSHSVCQHAVARREPLVVRDAREHPLVRDNLAIRDLDVVAYLGIPLLTSEGAAIGSFCVIDHRPRDWTADEIALLEDLAASATTEIELRTAERAAAESAARLGVAMEAARLGAWSFHLARGRCWHAATTNELHGRGHVEELLTVDDWLHCLHPDDRVAATSAFQAATSSADGRIAAEYRVVWPDGTVRWVAAAGQLVHQGAGTEGIIVGTVQDVTDRRSAETRLRNSERDLRSFVEAVPLLAWLNSADGSTTFFNRRWYDYSGQDESHLSGTRWMEVLHPNDRQLARETRDRAIAAGRPYELELRMRRTDGVYRWFAARVAPVRAADGSVVAWAGAALDVDDRRRLDAELRESEARFRAVQDASPDASVLMRALRDEEGRISDLVITYANDGASRTLLSRPEPLVGRTMREAFPESVDAGHLEIYRRVIETGETWQQDVHYTRTGLARGLRVTAVKVGDGVHIGVVDLSERLRAAEERERLLAAAEAARADAERARREAEAANAVKAQFLATMSHELRTPLNAIGGYAHLIELGVHGPVTPAQLEALGRIQRSQQHLLGLINEVLNYAKLEAGTVTYDLQEIPVLEIVRAVEPLVAPQARAQGLTLTVEGSGAALRVHADPEKARQVVLNLLSNAVKFTPPGGSVAVRAEPVPAGPGGAPMVALRVEDTGRGIAPEQLDRIFQPFVQVGRRLTAEHEGTGLGLAISRDLARGMAGDLTVESEVGAGSTFTLRLPGA